MKVVFFNIQEQLKELCFEVWGKEKTASHKQQAHCLKPVGECNHGHRNVCLIRCQMQAPCL